MTTSDPARTVPPAVEFRDVSISFGSFVAVDRISLSIPRGTMLTLLGPSGCGKTTTLRLIAGLEMASSGQILVNGEDVTGRPPSSRDISMVFQYYALFPHMSVLANVRYGLMAEGIAQREADRRALEVIDLVGLAGLGHRLPGELSGGQQQRVAVARAIVLEPAVLLLDEPLSNLDARLRRQVRDDIRALQQRLRLTAVYVTHDQEEAMAVSDRIVVMNRGRIAQTGTPRELYREPADRFVATFMGETNLIEALVEAPTSAGRVRVSFAGAVIEVPARGHGPGIATLAVRPEAIRIAPAEANPRGGLAGSVASCRYLGDRVEYVVETAAGPLLVRVTDDEAELPPGTDVRLTILPSRVCLIPS